MGPQLNILPLYLFQKYVVYDVYEKNLEQKYYTGSSSLLHLNSFCRHKNLFGSYEYETRRLIVGYIIGEKM